MSADRMTREVSVEVLQRAFADSGMRLADVARGLGWYRKPSPSEMSRRRYSVGARIPDGTRVRQSLGLQPSYRSTSYERAVELIEAMGLDPVDYGL